MQPKTTRIQRLELENFRGIRHLVLDFEKNINVLVGVNGVGKTSILEALRILLADLLGTILDELSIYRFHVSQVARNIAAKANFEIQKDDIRFDQDHSSIAIKATIENLPLEWSNSIELLKGSVSTSRGSRELKEFSENLVQQNIPSSDLSLPLAIYYSLGRSSEPEKPLSSNREEQADQITAYEDALAGAGNSSTAQFINWFRRLEDFENEKRTEDPTFRDKQLQAVRTVVEELLPGFTALRIRRQPTRMVIRKGSIELDLKQLSDGERYLLTLGADIARRLALSNPLTDKAHLCSAIVLIDEIETHLHPAWQRRVIPALTKTFPNCQFIIATHSPQVLSEVRHDCIYVLTQDNEKTNAVHPEASFGRDSNRILEDLMGVDERPSDIKKKLSDYFQLLDQGRMEEAQVLREELESNIGSSDPELTRADVLLHTRELLSR